MVIKFKSNKHSLCFEGRFMGENMNGLKDLKMKSDLDLG